MALLNGGATALTATLVAQLIVSMSVAALPALAPLIAAARGVSPTYIGLYMALLYAAAMGSTLLASGAVIRHGSIRITQAALLSCAAGIACCALPSLGALACGALLIGIGSGPMAPASSQLLVRTTPVDRMSLVFSVRQTALPLGVALAGLALPALQAVVGWQYTLLAASAVNLIAAVAVQPLRKAFDADRDLGRRLSWGDFVHPIRLVLSTPPLRTLAGCSFVYCTAQAALSTYLVTFLTDSLAYGLVAAGFLLSLSQLGAIVGRVFWGYLADRTVGAQRMLMVLGMLMPVCLVATGSLQPHTPFPLVVFVVVSLGACTMGWNGIQAAQAARHAPPGLAAVATAGTLAIAFVGLVVGPPLFGAVAAVSGSYRVGFFAVAVPLGLTALALWRR